MELTSVTLVHSDNSNIQKNYSHNSEQQNHECIRMNIACQLHHKFSYHHHCKYYSKQLIYKLKCFISAIACLTGPHSPFHTFLCECCFILYCHQFLPCIIPICKPLNDSRLSNNFKPGGGYVSIVYCDVGSGAV